MNVSVMKWLLANRQALLDCIEVAKGWKESLPYDQKWQIVDAIARKLIPLLTPAKALSLIEDDDADAAYDDFPSVCMSIGAECSAMGFDWKLVLDVIVPIIISILQAIAAKSGG